MISSIPIGKHHSPLQERVDIEVDGESLFQHVHIFGQTGTGKSHLLKQLFLHRVLNGHGGCYIDPHGEDAPDILQYMPPDRFREVIYFNPADRAFPIGFNCFDGIHPDDKDLVTSETVATFYSLWADSWGARMTYILKHAIRALLDIPTQEAATLLALPRLLTDPTYRQWVVSHCRHRKSREFFTTEYDRWSKTRVDEYIQPIMNKVGQFVSSEVLANILGQPKSGFDIATMMERGQVLVVNLNQGKLGADDPNLIGALLVNAIQRAAMRRVNLSPLDEVRPDVLPPYLKPFDFHIDEFQNITTSASAKMFSELRKNRVSLTVAHQYLEQLSDPVCAALMGNAGTTIAFRVGPDDAAVSARKFETEPHVPPNLEDREFLIRYKSENTSATNHGRTSPTMFKRFNKGPAIVQSCRKRYAKPSELVGEAIDSWSENRRFDVMEYEGASRVRKKGRSGQPKSKRQKKKEGSGVKEVRHGQGKNVINQYFDTKLGAIVTQYGE